MQSANHVHDNTLVGEAFHRPILFLLNLITLFKVFYLLILGSLILGFLLIIPQSFNCSGLFLHQSIDLTGSNSNFWVIPARKVRCDDSSADLKPTMRKLN